MIPIQTIQKGLQLTTAILGGTLLILRITEKDPVKREKYQEMINEEARRHIGMQGLEKLLH